MNNTMPQGAQAPFSIDGQPVKSGVITGLSWEEVTQCFWAQVHAFPVIVDATDQTIDYWENYGFDFTSGIRYQES